MSMSLERFLQDLKNEKLSPNVSSEEIQDIEEGVVKFVSLLLEKVACREKLFKVRRLIKVGSFYETTKIGDPDEFDFLVELEGDCNVKIDCVDNPCSAHVKASDVDVTDHGMEVDGNLASSRVFHVFSDHIRRILSRAINEENELTILRCKTGQLSICPALYGKGPNVEIHLKWSKYVDGERECMDLFGISIDISVCIDCPAEILSAWSSLIDRNFFTETDETRVDSLLQSQNPSLEALGIDELSTTAQHYVPKPVLVVPSSSRLGPCRYGKTLYDDYTCWRISFAPVEVYCMKKLQKRHRICYCILKLLCKQRENFTSKGLGPEPALRSLSSYMLKNAVLAHNAACKDDLNETTCLEAIVDYLLKCAEKTFLPAFFFPKLNLWKAMNTGEIKPPTRILLRLKEFLFKEINGMKEENIILKTVWWDVLYMQKFFGDYEAEDFAQGATEVTEEQLPQSNIVEVTTNN